MKIFLSLAYDGTDYCGFQRQPNGRAVQNILERGLSQLFNQPILTTAAGRTDKGVHAEGQVVVFEAPRKKVLRLSLVRLPQALGSLLPKALCVKQALEVSTAFHPRFSAKARFYRYRLFLAPTARQASQQNRYSYALRLVSLTPSLFLHRLSAALRCFEGEKNFGAFSNQSSLACSKVRTVYKIMVTRRGNEVWLDFYANAFLRGMVRALVGSSLRSALKGLPIALLLEWLHGKANKACQAVPYRAPPQGLCLQKVFYSPIFGLTQ